MMLMPYNAEYSMLTLSDDVTRPALVAAVLRYFKEVLEPSPHYEAIQQVRARRALESANHETNRN